MDVFLSLILIAKKAEIEVERGQAEGWCTLAFVVGHSDKT